MYSNAHNTVLFACCATLFMCHPFANAIAQDATVESVIHAWKQREAATKTVRVAVSGDYMTGKGALMKGPPRDVVVKEQRVIEIDGEKMRHERKTQIWVDDTGTVEDFNVLSVFNGQQAKALNDSTRRDDRLHPMGWILTARHHTDRSNIYLFAVLAHFRPLSPPFGQIAASNLKIADIDPLIGNTKCIVVEDRQSKTTRVKRYWLSPEQDMSILRFASLDGDRVTLQVDTTFRLLNGMWCPATWSAVRFAVNNMVLDSASTAVTDIALNATIPAADFDIIFFPGTEVFDRLSKQRYIVDPNGGKRIVTQAESERNARYSEIIKSPLGAAGIAPRSRRPGVLTVISICVVGAALLIVVMRRHGTL